MPQSYSNAKFWSFLKLVRWQNLLLLLLNLFLIKAVLIDAKFDFVFITLVVSIGLITASGYIINDIFDVAADQINKPKAVYVDTVFQKKTLLFYYYSLNILAIVLILIISKYLSIIFLATIFLLFIYAKYLKKTYLLGNLLVAFLSALPIMVFAYQYKMNVPILGLYAFFAFGISFIREIVKDGMDIKGDKEIGCQSIPIRLGLDKTYLIIKILYVIFIFCFVGLTIYYSINYGYFLIALVLIFGYFAFLLSKPNSLLHFSKLSQILKIMMLIGVLSMIFVKQNL